MKTVNISKKSWHYWLQRRSGLDDWRISKLDFCQYVRRLFWVIPMFAFISLFVLAMSLLILYSEGCFFAWLAYCLWNWDLIAPYPDAVPALCLNVIALTCTTIVAIVVFWVYIEERLPNCSKIPYCPETRDFVVSAWEVIHDKVCFKLEIK